MYSIHYRDRRRQARQEEVVLSQGIEISDPPVTAPQPLPPRPTKPATLVSSSAPAHRYQLPPNTTGQSRFRIRSLPRLPSPTRMPTQPRIIGQPIWTQPQFPAMDQTSAASAKSLKFHPVT